MPVRGPSSDNQGSTKATLTLAFIREETTSPDYACWTLCNTETVEMKDGSAEVPVQIFGSVLTPSSYDEAEARAAFRARQASDALILGIIDRLNAS